MNFYLLFYFEITGTFTVFTKEHISFHFLRNIKIESFFSSSVITTIPTLCIVCRHSLKIREIDAFLLLSHFFESKFFVPKNEITFGIVREISRYFEQFLRFHYEIRPLFIMRTVLISLLSHSENQALGP